MLVWSNKMNTDGDVAELAEGGTLLRCYMEQSVSRVRIPASPNFKKSGQKPAFILLKIQFKTIIFFYMFFIFYMYFVL